MNRFPRLLMLGFDAPTRESIRDTLTPRGIRVVEALGDADVIVVGAPAAVSPEGAQAVVGGLGLVAVGAPEGLALLGATAHVTPTSVCTRAQAETAWPDEDLLARVDVSALTSHTAYAGEFTALLRAGANVVAAPGSCGDGRVVLLGASGSPALLEMAIFHAARRRTVESTGSSVAMDPAWLDLKNAVLELREMQIKDGSIPSVEHHARARALVTRIDSDLVSLAPTFAHDADYFAALSKDLDAWVAGGFGVPDFYDSIVAFAPAAERRDGMKHLVLFPMYTQNGSPDRLFEAVLIEVIWPEFIADLEAGAYSNKLFLSIRFLDFTPGYDTHSAVLFPETVAMRAVPEFTWGAIFQDREAARFRRVLAEAARVTRLALPPDAARMLTDQALTEETFVMWDLIHDRTHMRGDLPFDPFMIKQRMPYFLYSLEELRCDLTAFRESVKLEAEGVPHARLVQYAVLFDRIFRFSITGSRVRNYDGLGGQLLFAWLHQARVLHWTDNRLTIEWDRVAEHVLALGEAIEDLYWRSIDRPKISHWLAAYELVSSVVEPHPASVWAKGKSALPLTGPLKEMTDAVLDDEFPLSMFFEALSKKMGDVIESTAGITA